jgi:hypothetical protein
MASGIALIDPIRGRIGDGRGGGSACKRIHQ